ncbi:MAG: hypothetical protein JW725_04235 [Candidatus Babeliaceae bacterium]|nr:hypothetical protein [Candidatus Babeliaceae bacterium]
MKKQYVIAFALCIGSSAAGMQKAIRSGFRFAKLGFMRSYPIAQLVTKNTRNKPVTKKGFDKENFKNNVESMKKFLASKQIESEIPTGINNLSQALITLGCVTHEFQDHPNEKLFELLNVSYNLGSLGKITLLESDIERFIKMISETFDTPKDLVRTNILAFLGYLKFEEKIQSRFI